MPSLKSISRLLRRKKSRKDGYKHKLRRMRSKSQTAAMISEVIDLKEPRETASSISVTRDQHGQLKKEYLQRKSRASMFASRHCTIDESLSGSNSMREDIETTLMREHQARQSSVGQDMARFVQGFHDQSVPSKNTPMKQQQSSKRIRQPFLSPRTPANSVMGPDPNETLVTRESVPSPTHVDNDECSIDGHHHQPFEFNASPSTQNLVRKLNVNLLVSPYKESRRRQKKVRPNHHRPVQIPSCSMNSSIVTPMAIVFNHVPSPSHVDLNENGSFKHDPTSFAQKELIMNHSIFIRDSENDSIITNDRLSNKHCESPSVMLVGENDGISKNNRFVFEMDGERDGIQNHSPTHVNIDTHGNEIIENDDCESEWTEMTQMELVFASPSGRMREPSQKVQRVRELLNMPMNHVPSPSHLSRNERSVSRRRPLLSFSAGLDERDSLKRDGLAAPLDGSNNGLLSPGESIQSNQDAINLITPISQTDGCTQLVFEVEKEEDDPNEIDLNEASLVINPENHDDDGNRGMAGIVSITRARDFSIGPDFFEKSRMKSDSIITEMEENQSDTNKSEDRFVIKSQKTISMESEITEWNGFKSMDGTGSLEFNQDKRLFVPRTPAPSMMIGENDDDDMNQFVQNALNSIQSPQIRFKNNHLSMDFNVTDHFIQNNPFKERISLEMTGYIHEWTRPSQWKQKQRIMKNNYMPRLNYLEGVVDKLVQSNGALMNGFKTFLDQYSLEKQLEMNHHHHGQRSESQSSNDSSSSSSSSKKSIRTKNHQHRQRNRLAIQRSLTTRSLNDGLDRIPDSITSSIDSFSNSSDGMTTHSSARALQRKKFDNLIKIKNDLESQSQIAENMQRELTEEKRLREYRKSLEFKANPMPQF